jgi:hypothetical protein
MAAYPECATDRKQRVYRIIDDGDCVLTMLDAEKALLALMELLDKHEINTCWADVETLQ